ncbi:MAG TPA: preprotein translocase subunit YajC [Planctomycetota bacterium]|nr:preprotein translocase subunit YajC [Planctomycetota bacterium]
MADAATDNAAQPAPAQPQQNMAKTEEELANQQTGQSTEEKGGNGEQTPPPQSGIQNYGFFLVIAAMFAIMYFMLIRPQKKREKERREMLSDLKKGDKVATIGGIIGTITSINDREVVLQVEDGGKLRFTRSAISRPQGEGRGDTTDTT